MAIYKGNTLVAGAGIYIKETGKSSDGLSWYRLWSDGWLEQGGRCYCPSNGVRNTFLKPFKNANYTIQLQIIHDPALGSYAQNAINVNTLTITSFMSGIYNGGNPGRLASYYACGEG